MKIETKVANSFLLSLFVMLLAACGGGGGGGGGGATSDIGTGAVGLTLTDKPADLAEIDKILITITAVEIFAEDGSKVTLYNGRPRGPFDLLELEHESRPLVYDPDVPVGTYCKIRLTLSDLELVFNNGDPNFKPRLPGNNKLDLNPKDCFQVTADSKLYLQLDMDAKSIHVVQTGNKKHYNFRPVVFIDVIQRDVQTKLVRLENGLIDEIDSDAGTLLLCEFSYGDNARGEPEDCMTILISRQTSAFDNVDDDGINEISNGDAISLADLLVQGRVGTTPVTVVGRFSEAEPEEGTYPVIDALVVELGGFLNLEGTVASGASDIRFNMNVDPDQGISTEGELPVALQAAPAGGNGTKILSRTGEVLSSSDITPPRQVMVDGVLQLPDPSFLNASLVIVDLSDDMEKDEASGTIVELVDPDGLRVEADSFPCEVGTGVFNVSYDSQTNVYDSILPDVGWVDTDALSPRQEVDIIGVCEGTTLAASSIIIRE